MLWTQYAQFEKRIGGPQSAVRVLARAVALLPRSDTLWRRYVELAADPAPVYQQWAERSDTAWPEWYANVCRRGAPRHTRDDVLRSWVSKFDPDLAAWVSSADARTVQTAIDALEPPLASRIAAAAAAAPAPAPAPAAEQHPAATASPTAQICTIEDSRALCKSDPDLWWATLNVCARVDLFEAALAACAPKTPPSAGKTVEWRQYARLWARYASFVDDNDDKDGKDDEGSLPAARSVYERALACYDHARFSSASLWAAYARHFVRRGDLASARKVFGSALGKTRLCTSSYVHILAEYVQLEQQHGDSARCRKLYEMLVLAAPTSSDLWLEWSEFERANGEEARCVYILRTALGEPELLLADRNALYYAWADVEGPRSLRSARRVWEELVALCGGGGGGGAAAAAAAVHSPPPDVQLDDAWMRYAMYELSIGWDEETETASVPATERARSVFQRGLAALAPGSAAHEVLEGYFEQFEELFPAPAPDDNDDSDSDNGQNAQPASTDAASDDSPLQKLLAKAQQWQAEQQRTESA